LPSNGAVGYEYSHTRGPAGLYNLGHLREEGKAAQHQLWDLHTLLMEMCKQIREHSVLKDKLSPEEWGGSFKCFAHSHLQTAHAMASSDASPETPAKIYLLLHHSSLHKCLCVLPAVLLNAFVYRDALQIVELLW